MKRIVGLLIASMGIYGISAGQTASTGTGKTVINGELVTYMVNDCGDTLLIANLGDVSVSSPRKFENREDYLRYQRYRRYAATVYPYAGEAIKIFRQVEHQTDEMRKGKRKKYVKDLQKELKEKFEDPLKKLTKTQGMILMKMIEKELDTPMYTLIKNLRGGFTASYWSTLGKFYGHHLKEGYHPGEDIILDAVLNDMDVSYELPE